MGNVGTILPVRALGSVFGTQVLNSQVNNEGIFAAGRPTTPADLQAIDSVITGQPGRALMEGYVYTRGVLSPDHVVNLDQAKQGLEQAQQEVKNFGKYLKAKDPAAFQKYKALLTDGVNQLMAKHPGMNSVTATGIVLATQPYADPQHPTPDEIKQTSIGLDLNAATILYEKSLTPLQH